MERLRRQDLWRRHGKAKEGPIPMDGRLPSLECGKVREDAGGILRVVWRRPFSPRA